MVGLLVASMLMVGLIELTRRYARTASAMTATVSDSRAGQALGQLFQQLERADPGTLELSADRLTARLGASEIIATLHSAPGGRMLDWRSAGLQRTLPVPADARFERTPGGLVAIMTGVTPVPVVHARTRRQVGADCRFDTVTLECRP